MVYRQAGVVEREPPVVVTYGPFGRPWLASGLILTIVVAFALGMTCELHGNRLRCERDETGEGTCSVESNYRFVSRLVVSFAIDQVTDVRFETYEGSKGARMGRTRIVYSSGQSIVVADGSRSDAEEVNAEILDFFDDEYQPSIDVTMPLSVASMIGFFFVVFVGLAAILGFLSATTSIEIAIDREERRIGVKRKGIWQPREVTYFELDGIADVVVTKGLISAGRKGQTVEAGRLTLIYADGRKVSLTDAFIPGTTVHVLAQGQLKKHLINDKQSRHSSDRGAPGWS